MNLANIDRWIGVVKLVSMKSMLDYHLTILGHFQMQYSLSECTCVHVYWTNVFSDQNVDGIVTGSNCVFGQVDCGHRILRYIITSTKKTMRQLLSIQSNLAWSDLAWCAWKFMGVKAIHIHRIRSKIFIVAPFF